MESIHEDWVIHEAVDTGGVVLAFLEVTDVAIAVKLDRR